MPRDAVDSSMNYCPRPVGRGQLGIELSTAPRGIVLIITQPTIYRVIAYFSLYHELVSDRSIVFGYNMELYHGLVPSSKKIIYNGLVPSSKDVRAIAMFHYVTGWP